MCGPQIGSGRVAKRKTLYVGGNRRWYLSVKRLCVSQFRSGRVAKSKTLYVGGNRRWYLSEKRLCVSQFRSGRVAKRKLGTSGYPVNSLVTILKLLTPPSQGLPVQPSASLSVDTQHQNGNKCEVKRDH
jgi:hypothetical protein